MAEKVAVLVVGVGVARSCKEVMGCSRDDDDDVDVDDGRGDDAR